MDHATFVVQNSNQSRKKEISWNYIAKSAKRLHAYKIRTETESMWQSHNHQHIKQLRG